MEANIPVAIPKKERTLTDVLQEAAAESASMLGSNAVAKGVSFLEMLKKISKGKEQAFPQDAEQIVIYEDEETGDLFFIDENDNEVLCDENGFPLDDGDEKMTELDETVVKAHEEPKRWLPTIA